jgi:hypothetical protein
MDGRGALRSEQAFTVHREEVAEGGLPIACSSHLPGSRFPAHNHPRIKPRGDSTSVDPLQPWLLWVVQSSEKPQAFTVEVPRRDPGTQGDLGPGSAIASNGYAFGTLPGSSGQAARPDLRQGLEAANGAKTRGRFLPGGLIGPAREAEAPSGLGDHLPRSARVKQGTIIIRGWRRMRSIRRRGRGPSRPLFPPARQPTTPPGPFPVQKHSGLR